MPSANVSWPVPLQRLTPWYPGQPGVPGTDSDRGLRLDSNGKIIYVDRNHVDAHDQRDGTNPDSPMATVQAAVNKCREYMNDTVVVMHNSYWYDTQAAYSRQLPVAEDVIVTTPGIRIVGLAPPSTLGVPWIPGTTGGTCLTIHAFDVIVEGFNFMDIAFNNATAIYAEWNGTTRLGDALTVRHCYFNTFLDYGVRLDFSYHSDIHHNYFHAVDVIAVEDVAAGLDDSDFCRIHENFFNYCAVAIRMLAVTGCHIHHNTIMGDPTGTDNYIDLTGGVTNSVHHNVLNCSLGAQFNLTCSSAGSGAWVQNYLLNGPNLAPPT